MLKTSEQKQIYFILVSLALTGCSADDFLGRSFSSLKSKSLISNSISQTNHNGRGNNLAPAIGPSSNFGTSQNPTGLIFQKNPIKAGATNFYSTDVNGNISPPNEINFDNFLTRVPITGTTDGRLRNQDIIVSAFSESGGFSQSPTTQEARANSQGNWDFSSSGDPSHGLGQVMAYYWISQEKSKAVGSLQNSWAPSGKKIPIFTYYYDARFELVDQAKPFDQVKNPYKGFNSFFAFDSNSIGQDMASQNSEADPADFVYLSVDGAKQASYDASVYAHEMGHANIAFATNFAIYQGDTHSIPCFQELGPNNLCCDSTDGCGLAINEGQADYHSFMMFNDTVVGDFYMGNLAGLPGRNASLNGSLKTSNRFLENDFYMPSDTSHSTPLQFGKEGHWMGGVWNAALWTMRTTLGADAADKVFLMHLSRLTGNDTFKTALAQLVQADLDLVAAGVFGTNHTQGIIAAFSQHGITLN